MFFFFPFFILHSSIHPWIFTGSVFLQNNDLGISFPLFFDFWERLRPGILEQVMKIQVWGLGNTKQSWEELWFLGLTFSEGESRISVNILYIWTTWASYLGMLKTLAAKWFDLFNIRFPLNQRWTRLPTVSVCPTIIWALMETNNQSLSSV